MTFLLKSILVAISLFGAVTTLMYFVQRKLQYFPETTRTAPSAAGLAAEEMTLDTKDGERIILWHVPPRSNRPVILYFHGNGGSLRYRAERFRGFTADGTGLVAVSYRGYGGSSGSPTEDGLLADAEAAYAFATANYPPERIVLFGESLGSGISVALAAKRKVAAVILEAPFTSAVDIGASAYWYLPVRLLMKDQFRSDERIAGVTVPILILHGTADRVIPLRYGERLFALANEPKRMQTFPGGGHSDLDTFGAQAVVRAFINETVREGGIQPR